MTELQTDEVTILLSRGDPIGIPWESRQALLAEMPPSSMQPTRTAFEEVGTSAPVNLTREQKRDVITISSTWRTRWNKAPTTSLQVCSDYGTRCGTT